MVAEECTEFVYPMAAMVDTPAEELHRDIIVLSVIFGLYRLLEEDLSHRAELKELALILYHLVL